MTSKFRIEIQFLNDLKILHQNIHSIIERNGEELNKERYTKLINQRFIIFKISSIYKMVSRFHVTPIKKSQEKFLYVFAS